MIPNRIFFIWLGKNFPWSAGIAVLSALRVQKPEEVAVYSDVELQGEGFDLIKNEKGITFKIIDNSVFKDLGDDGICEELCNKVKSPASKANLLRLALLYKHGGIYLDTDTVFVKPIDDLLKFKGFCGTETVALPRELFKSINPFAYLICGLRFAWRFFCTYCPSGEQIFRKTEKFFSQSANNAVLASEAKNPIIANAFKEINLMKESTRLRRYRLGTHLLQSITRNKSSEFMEVLPNCYFYPLGPEICRHYFLDGSGKRLSKMLLPETRIVHWYNSVERRFLSEPLNAAWTLKHPSSAFTILSPL
ncbi:MAG: hypothetical protein LBC64_06770 [Fibromonadaceae bacterium]|jgi:hypothetical protein|nr:hypothetical protein [Fibromonadaceae bacterium]